MASIQETIDFDGDGLFSGKDLDITWAYLQIKALYDTGTSDVTSDNFRDKVVEQYNLNKTNSIAEANTNDIKSLPGMLSLGLALGKKQVRFQKRWTLNDMWNSHDLSNPRSSKIPTDAWESISGEIAGSMENVSWTGKTTDADLIWMANNSSSKISLVDGGTLRSDKSWTLHFQATMRTFNGVLFAKGTDFSDWNANPFFKLHVFASSKKIGIYTGTGVKNWFLFPAGTTKADYSNKKIDFYFVRVGQNVRMFIDNGIAGPRECKQEIAGALPELINMVDMYSPLVFDGRIMASLSDVWVADNEFKADDLPYLTKPENTYRIRHDLNLETSYFAWKNLFQDPYGNYGQILGFPGRETNQAHWDSTHSSDGTHFGYVPRSRCLKLSKANHYLAVNNVNFGSNFTVSFWVRTASTSAMVEFVGETDNFALQPHYSQPKMRFRFAGTEKKLNIISQDYADVTSNDKPLADDWYHITLVKNRNLIGFWVNGTIGDYDYIELDDAQMSDIGWSVLRLKGDGVGVYYSDIRVLDYAMCNVPAKGYGKKSTYSFIDTLKTGQDITGSALNLG